MTIASQQRRTRSTARWQHARAAARRRDGNRCRRCGSTEKLEVHHIVSLAKGGAMYDLSNLMTLCAPCHHQVEGGGVGTSQAFSHPSAGFPRNKLTPRPRFSRSKLSG